MLLVGSGDNGGDALYAGARLARRGARVDALLLGRPGRTRPASPRCARAGGRVVDDRRRTRADLVVDGILGIGGRGGLRDRAAERRRAAARRTRWSSPSTCPAASTPSTGEVDGRRGPRRRHRHLRRAQARPARRPGRRARRRRRARRHRARPAGCRPSRCCRPTTWPAAAARRTASRTSTAAASSASRPARTQYTGAAVLCAGGALRGGAGHGALRRRRRAGRRWSAPRWPEVVVGEGRVQAWAVGSGGGGDAAGRLARAVADGVPVVVDADALAALARPPGRPAVPLLLTPHAGELARLLGVDRADVEARRLHHARAAARDLDAVVLLKGSTTVVARPDGRVRVNPTGTPGAGDRGLAATCWPGSAARCSPAGSTRSTPARSAPGCTGWPAGSPPTAADRSPRRRARRPAARGALPRRAPLADCVTMTGPADGTPSPGSTSSAIRANVEALRARTTRRGDGGGQGRRLRPRPGALGPGRGRGRRDLARAPRCSTRRWRCAPPASPTPRVLAWLLGPGERLRRRAARRHRPVGQRRLGARRGGRRGPRDRDDGPGAPQGRHRPEPRRCRPRRLAGPGRRRAQGRGRGRGAGGRALVALRLRRRARPPDDRRARPRCSATPSRTPRRPGSTPRCGTWPTRPRR